ncbi:MAG: VWA domain-containing protein [Thermoanaerobaculia bacterium]|nr:VWA domain-containing protein [Thermoanaerobaculia bacterium]
MATPRASLLSASLALTLSIVTGLTTPAQYIERVEVTVANVDVVVTDAQGNPVRGLTKDDFEIFEDGKLQPITNFSAIDVAPGVAPAAGGGEPKAGELPQASAPQRRMVVFFVDIADIEPSRRVKFFKGIRDFCDDVLRDDDLVSVLTWNHRVRIALPPTTRRDELDAVLDALGSPFGSGDKAIAETLASLSLPQASGDSGLAQSLGFAPTADASSEEEFRRWLHEEEHCDSIRRKAEEMRTVVAALARVDMQKLLVFASDDTVLMPAIGCVLRPRFEAIADTANAYGMTIHSFHPPGARDNFVGPDRGRYVPSAKGPASFSTDYERAFTEAGGLHAMAERTGGYTGIGPAQSAKLLARAARELDLYYSLGYRVPSSGDDKPHTIKVSTKNPKLRVRVRESIVHLSEGSRIRDLVTTNLYLPVEEPKGPAFSVTLGEGRRDGRFVVLPVEVLFDAQQLALLPGSEGKSKGAFTLFIASGRELGDASDVTEVKYAFDIPTPSGDGTPANVLYTFGVRVRPDTRRLSVALRDDTSGDIGARVVPIPATK